MCTLKAIYTYACSYINNTLWVHSYEHDQTCTPYTIYICICMYIYISEESMQGKAPTYAKPPRIEKRDGCRQREARERGERVRERERGTTVERGKS